MILIMCLPHNQRTINFDYFLLGAGSNFRTFLQVNYWWFELFFTKTYIRPYWLAPLDVLKFFVMKPCSPAFFNVNYSCFELFVGYETVLCSWLIALKWSIGFSTKKPQKQSFLPFCVTACITTCAVHRNWMWFCFKHLQPVFQVVWIHA